MKRTLLWTALGLAATLLAAVVLVNVRAGDAAPLPPPDAALPISLPDGRSLPLADLLARLREEPAPVEPLVAAADLPADGRISEARAAALLGDAFHEPYPGLGRSAVFQLAEYHRKGDRPEQALALYQSVEPGHPDWGIAQRRIGWEILTLALDDPHAGVPYVHAALAADPVEGNGWQDAARVYAHTLGLPID